MQLVGVERTFAEDFLDRSEVESGMGRDLRRSNVAVVMRGGRGGRRLNRGLRIGWYWRRRAFSRREFVIFHTSLGSRLPCVTKSRCRRRPGDGLGRRRRFLLPPEPAFLLGLFALPNHNPIAFEIGLL